MRSSLATAAAGAVRNPLAPDAWRSVHRRLADVALAAMLAMISGGAVAGAAGRDATTTRVPRFSEHPAGAAFRGTPAAPDFKRNPAAEPFATQLREGARRGPNFAGYLRVVEWSCGISCKRWMVVNVRNGRIHDSPEPAFSLEYQVDSRLLVVNTVGRFTAADPPAGVPIAKYYVWRNERLELIHTRATRTGSAR